MSCQHAMVMGKFGGHNVAARSDRQIDAADTQPFYATCLDLGEWGAVYSEGWDRQIKLTHAEGKARERDDQYAVDLPTGAESRRCVRGRRPASVIWLMRWYVSAFGHRG